MITVTGATGLTGRHLFEGLVAVGLPVRALVHNEQAVRRLPARVAETVVGDMLVPADTERAVAGSDAVVHIGPVMHPREIAMGETVIEAATAADVGHFLQMSVTHPQLNHPSKLAAERRLLMSPVPFTILQPMHYMQDVDVATTVSEGVFRQPFSLDMPMSFVDLADVGEVAALVLSDPQRALKRRFARVVFHLLQPTNDAAPACLPTAA